MYKEDCELYKNEMDDLLRLVIKREVNSHYPVYVSNVYRFYDKKIAEEIAKCGEWQIRKLIENFKSK
jgi:DNA polymerase elongation subunit (family B)